MRGLNRIGEPKVTLIGKLGDNPEIQKLQGAANVAKLSLATIASFKDAKGQLHYSTDWHTIILRRGLTDRRTKAKVPAKGEPDLRGGQTKNADRFGVPMRR